MIFSKTATQARRGPYVTRASTSVKRLRVQQNMTQLECAKFCRVSLRTFQRVESGDAVPRDVVRTVERALGLPW